MLNNNKRFTIFIFILLIFFIVLNFTQKKDEIYKNFFEEEPQIKDDTQERFSVREIFEESNEFYKMKVNYAKDSWDKNDLAPSFIKEIIKEKKEAWQINGSIYNEEIELNKMFPDRPKMVYEIVIDYNQYLSSIQNTVSYVYKIYEFTGGAHGNTYLKTFTFNKDGFINIENILNLDNKNDVLLTRILNLKLKEVLKEYADESTINSGLGLTYLKEDGTFDYDACQCFDFSFKDNFRNFVVEDDGIKFIFGQYQVAPYVAGMPEVKFNISELREYFKNIKTE